MHLCKCKFTCMRPFLMAFISLCSYVRRVASRTAMMGVTLDDYKQNGGHPRPPGGPGGGGGHGGGRGGQGQGQTKATFSGMTALTAVVALLLAIISAAVPHWGYYAPVGYVGRNRYVAAGKTNDLIDWVNAFVK